MDSIGGQEPDMSTSPLEKLELQAMEQRNQLHQTATELKGKISATREKFELTRNAREHFAGMAIAVSVLGLIAGYAAAGLFIND